MKTFLHELWAPEMERVLKRDLAFRIEAPPLTWRHRKLNRLRYFWRERIVGAWLVLIGRKQATDDF